jgi:AcrR family transcriptional regulator
MPPSQPPGEPLDTIPADIRERVTPAVLDELAHWGLERFSIEALAQRHHLDAAMIYRYWGDRQRLIVDTVFAEAESMRFGTDTGSLRGDLLALARNMTDQINAGVGRTFLRALVMDPSRRHDEDTRVRLWRARSAAVRAILERARERGELRDGVNTMAAGQILLAPLYMFALYSDDAVDDKYCEAVADMAWHALARK